MYLGSYTHVLSTDLQFEIFYHVLSIRYILLIGVTSSITLLI